MQHWHKIVVIFPPIYLPEATYVISLFNLMIELLELIPHAIIIP